MEPMSWDRVKQIFQEVLEKTGEERAALLGALCGDDRELRSQVETLLAAHGEAGEFLRSQTVEGAGEAAAAAAGVAAQAAPEGPGARIGAYKLLQLIGEGGFGAVYMAEQEQPIRRRVALKIIKPGMDSKQVIARFEAERQALALLDHPNIAKVLDAGATGTGRPYFVMELVRGIPITEFCDKYRLSTRERLELFRDTCAALNHAHQAGIIHRDIKPSNVLVTLHDGEPMPKVIDFGVAKAMHHRLTEKTLFTEYSQFIGTPAYMSPEQAELGAVEVDARTDVYSLGVLLYELLTGSTPIDGSTLRRAAYLELLRILRDEEPPKPSTRLSTLGDEAEDVAKNRQADAGALEKLLRGDLDWIAMKAIEKNRNRRYDTAAELAADIDRYFERDPILARPPSPAYRIQKFVTKRRGPLAAAAVIALAFTAAGGYSAWRTKANANVLGTAAAPSGTGLRLIAESEQGRSGDINARPGRDGRDFFVWVRGRGIESVDIATSARRLAVSDWPDHAGLYSQQIDVSPDGSRLAAVVPHQSDEAAGPGERQLSIRVFDVGGRWPGREIASWSPQGAHDVVLEGWSPDGRRIWFKGRRIGPGSSTGYEIASVDEVTGTVEVLRSFEWGWDHTKPSLSPDGRFIAYSHASIPDDADDLFILATDGSAEYRVEHPAHDIQPVFAPDGSGIVFVSDRRGLSDLWFLPVREGRPTGPAILAWRDVRFGDRGPLRFASNGSLFFEGPMGGRRIGTATIDDDGEAIGFADPLSSPIGGELSRPAYSPSGRHLAYLRGLRRLVVRDLETDAERDFPVANDEDLGPGPKWCHDSGALTFSGIKNGTTIHRVGPDGGVALITGPVGEACLGNGDAVLHVRAEAHPGAPQGILRYDLSSGRETVLFEGVVRGWWQANRISVSPDGSRMAFVTTDRDESDLRLLVQPIDGGPPREVLSRKFQGDPLTLAGWLSDDEILAVDLSWPGDEKYMVIPTNGGPARRLRISTERSASCDVGVASNFSVHPDGHRIAFTCRDDWRVQTWAMDGLMELVREARPGSGPQ